MEHYVNKNFICNTSCCSCKCFLTVGIICKIISVSLTILNRSSSQKIQTWWRNWKLCMLFKYILSDAECPFWFILSLMGKGYKYSTIYKAVTNSFALYNSYNSWWEHSFTLGHRAYTEYRYVCMYKLRKSCFKRDTATCEYCNLNFILLRTVLFYHFLFFIF